MKKNLLRSFIIVIIFFLAGFFLIGQNISKHNPADIKYIKIAGQTVKVELALTMEEQAQGLSGRQGLNYNEGMLFVFPQSGNYPFWMKEMNFPIDIIWLDEDLQIVYIKKDARPESYPETYGPQKNQQDVKYVLEVVSGFSDKNDLKVGDKIENFVSP